MTENRSKSISCESLLRTIAGCNPTPWYPRAYALEHALERSQLDEALTELRLSGIIQLTDWFKDTGQGYRITEYGNEVLGNPAMMERLKGPFEVQAIALKVGEPAHAVRVRTATTPFERGEIVREALLAPQKVIVTNALIAVNALAFIICLAQCFRFDVSLSKFMMQGDAGIIRRLGGLSAVEIASGHWMNLFTYAFLHFGILHLIMNMMALAVLGRFLESAWGSGRFLLIYCLSILGGSTACMVFSPFAADGTPTLVAGASGAIWGLFVAQLVWMVFNRSHIRASYFKTYLNNWFFAFAVNMGISFLPFVSMSGHLGGGAVGGMAAVLLYLHWHYSPGYKALAFAVLAVMPFVCILLIMNAMRNSSEWRALIDLARIPVDI